MTGSDEIRNTGGNMPQTLETEPKKSISNYGEHEGYTEKEDFTQQTMVIEGDISAGIGTAGGMPDTLRQDQQPPRKPHLSPEQQVWLNKVFIPNFRRELIKNLKTADMKPGERKEKNNETLNNKSADKGFEQALADKEKALADIRLTAEKEHEKLMGIISEMKIDRELVASAARQNSVHPSQIAQLLRGSVRLNNEMAPVVLDDDGEPAVNEEGRPMTIDEKVKRFLDENPHFARPSGTGSGSGSADSIVGQMHIAAATGGDLIGAALREEKQKQGYPRR